MLIVGELINSTRKKIRMAIEEQDAAYIMDIAKRQDQAGADYLDVNAGAFHGTETEKLLWLIETVRSVSQKPLTLDSPDPAVLKAALEPAGKPVMINSISAETDRYQKVIPLVQESGASVIALSMDDEGMTNDPIKIFDVITKLVERLNADGVSNDRIFIDPLIKPLSTDDQSAKVSLAIIEKTMTTFEGIHTTCGLSNVSFGLPKRKLLNQTFMVMAIAHGLDSAVVDPLDQRMIANIIAAESLAGRDQFCMNYLNTDRAGILEGAV